MADSNQDLSHPPTLSISPRDAKRMVLQIKCAALQKAQSNQHTPSPQTKVEFFKIRLFPFDSTSWR